MRTQRGAGKGEHGGVDASRFAAHEKRLVAQEIRDRVDRSCPKREDFVKRMPSKTLAMKPGPHLTADHRRHERPDRRRDLVEEPGRAFTEIPLIHPSVVE